MERLFSGRIIVGISVVADRVRIGKQTSVLELYLSEVPWMF